MINCRNFHLLAVGVAASGNAFAGFARAESKTFRIAFQKGGGNLIFLKERDSRAQARAARLVGDVDRVSGRPAVD